MITVQVGNERYLEIVNLFALGNNEFRADRNSFDLTFVEVVCGGDDTPVRQSVHDLARVVLIQAGDVGYKHGFDSGVGVGASDGVDADKRY